MVQLVLPDAGKVVLAVLLVYINLVCELAKIHWVVVEHLRGIREHLGAVGTCALFLGIYGLQLIKQRLVRRSAIGVIVLLKHRAVIEILELLRRHKRVVGHKGFQQAGIKITRVLVGRLARYRFHIRLSELGAGALLGKYGHQADYGRYKYYKA